MPVITTTSGKIALDLKKLGQAAGAYAVGHILERVDQGKDIHDRAFTGYSPSYKQALVEMGEGTATDIRLTGGMLNSLRVQSVEVVNGQAIVTIGPGTGTSPQVAPPAKGKARAKRTGKRGPPHNLVGLWIHRGTSKMPARPWLGVSPQGLRELASHLMRASAAWLKGKK